MKDYYNYTMFDNKVNQAIFDALLMRGSKPAKNGFKRINCPSCLRRHEKSADTKYRCGIIAETNDQIGVNCFNCGLHLRWTMGTRISNSMKQFLIDLGISSQEINKLSYWADSIQNLLEKQPELSENIPKPIPLWQSVDLPPKTKSIEHWAELGCEDEDYLDTVQYLFSRGDDVVNASTYYWSPIKSNDLNRRLIIPCYQNENIVGWTARAIDKNIKTRYWKEIPQNYLFNSKFLTSSGKYIFIVEGVFDALVLDAVAPLGASLNSTLVSWVKQSGKTPVVVPDRDRRGMELVEVAIENKWAVATVRYHGNQWWDSDIKDPDAAVKKYGKLYTVQSILSNLTINENLIRQRIIYINIIYEIL